MRSPALVSIACFIGLQGCNKEEVPPLTAATTPASPTAAAVPEKGATEQAFVTYVTGLKREASEAKKIDDPTGKKKQLSNWIMTLYRGEEVTVLKVEGDWAQVRASDDSAGFIKKDGLLPTGGVTLATLFESTKTFNRPDLLALNASKTLDPGMLLFVLKTKDQFSEINHSGSNSVWVLSEKLATDPNEIAASKLLNKVRWMKERKDPDADKVMELARTQFASSRLVTMLDTVLAPTGEMGETANAADAPEPAQPAQPAE